MDKNKSVKTATQVAVSVLRFVPIAILGALLLSWILGIFWPHALTMFYRDSRDQQIEVTVVSDMGSLALNWQPNYSPLQTFTIRSRDTSYSLATIMGGSCTFRQGELRGGKLMRMSMPIPWIITIMLPFVVGALTRFRFSLTMWLAWIAMICFNSACYALILRELSRVGHAPACRIEVEVALLSRIAAPRGQSIKVTPILRAAASFRHAGACPTPRVVSRQGASWE
jgi:hypothetical protein